MSFSPFFIKDEYEPIMYHYNLRSFKDPVGDKDEISEPNRLHLCRRNKESDNKYLSDTNKRIPLQKLFLPL